MTTEGTFRHPDGKETYANGVEVVRDASGKLVEESADADDETDDASDLLL